MRSTAGDHPSDKDLSLLALGPGSQLGRLLNNMDNVRQDRVPDPTLERASAPAPEGTAVNGRGGAPRTIMLSLRFRAPNRGGPRADLAMLGDSPAATLAIDVISASGGAPAPPQGPVMAARFSNLPSALLAARRLQWALEGLGETAGFDSAAASIAVHAMEDPASSAVVPLLDHVAPGQVLVSSRIAEAVQPLPGVTLRATVDGAWRELQWRSVDTQTGYSADERSVLDLIRALGREDPCPSQAEAPRPGAVLPEVPEAPQTLGRSVLEPEPESVFAKKKWFIIGGAAAAVLLAVLLLAVFWASQGKTPAQNPAAATQAPAPDTPTPPPVASPSTPVTEKPQTPKSGKSAKQPKAEAKGEQPAASKGPSGSCTLTDADISHSLNRAESYLHAGKLAEAEALYQRVQGCPSAREKAMDGLQRVHQRMATQGP